MQLSNYEKFILEKYKEAVHLARADFIEYHDIWLEVGLCEPNKKTQYAKWFKWFRRFNRAEQNMSEAHMKYLEAFRKYFDFKKSLNYYRDELVNKGLISNE